MILTVDEINGLKELGFKNEIGLSYVIMSSPLMTQFHITYEDLSRHVQQTSTHQMT